MTTALQRFFGAALFGLTLFCSVGASAQINYTESFDDDQHGWDLYEFEETEALPCTGAGALNVNLWFDWDLGGTFEAEMTSPSIGTSNGGELTVTFDYKLLDYPLTTIAPTTSDDWGAISIYWATSLTGPWTLIETIEPDDHVASEDCTTKTVSFFPPVGQEVYIDIYAEHSGSFDDFYVFIDEVTAIQAAPVQCSAAPATSAISATETLICTNEVSVLTIDNVYTDAGIAYQWQSSTDNVTYTDIIGATETEYEVSQTATTWYRAMVKCLNGNSSTPTQALQIASTGDICYCEVTFGSNEEPITLVEFGSISNTTSEDTASAVDYEDFTTTVPAPVLVKGEVYPIALEGNTAGNFVNYFTLFIDWNQNGNLNDEGEVFQVGTITNSTGVDGQQATANITVPASALIGETRMRVVKRYSAAGTACNATGYGQAEDYTVNVQATASAGSFDSAAFRYHPNPVKNVFNVAYTANISSVVIYNLVGQQVMAKAINATDAQIDMSALSAGTYMVKVNAENGTKTVKVIKQ